MNQETAVDFYDRIVQGTDYTKEITLEHSSGAALEGVQMHPVDKQTLAFVMQQLPEDMFEAVEEAEDADEAEEMLEDEGITLNAMSAETVDAFEQLCEESLRHPELTTAQMESIISALNFGLLFELGGQIIDMSFADDAAIKDFREQE